MASCMGVTDLECWLLDFNGMVENQEEEEPYVIDSKICVRQSKTQIKKKVKNIEKKMKKVKIAVKPTKMIQDPYHAVWRLNDCNVCRKCVAKTEAGGDIHKSTIHSKHKLRCAKKETCGSIYEKDCDLEIHQDLNPGH